MWSINGACEAYRVHMDLQWNIWSVGWSSEHYCGVRGALEHGCSLYRVCLTRPRVETHTWATVSLACPHSTWKSMSVYLASLHLGFDLTELASAPQIWLHLILDVVCGNFEITCPLCSRLVRLPSLFALFLSLAIFWNALVSRQYCFEDPQVVSQVMASSLVSDHAEFLFDCL